VGREAWLEDARFATNEARVRNRSTVVEMLTDLFRTRPAADWLELCKSIGIPSAPIQTVDRVFADPQVVARGLRTEVDHPSAGRLAMVASPLCIPTAPARVFRPPPLLGQHTDEILFDLLGYSAAEAAAWRKAGVI
jgi:formyl-CoA transferase